MIDDRFIEAAATGARRAGTHALRAAAEVLAAVMAFADEMSKAFDDDDEIERIEVEPAED